MEKNTENSKKSVEHLKPYQWKKGQSGNPGGRPKGSIKDYLRNKFQEMTDEEKEEFIKDLPKELQWKMAEGNPHQDTTIGGDIEKPIPILNVQQNNGNKSNNEPGQEDSGNLRRDISEQDSINPPIFDSPGTER